MKYILCFVLFIFIVVGCEEQITAPSDKPGSSTEPPPDTLENPGEIEESFVISDIFPGSNLVFAYLEFNNSQAILYTPGYKWTNEQLGKYLYLVQEDKLNTFYSTSLVEDSPIPSVVVTWLEGQDQLGEGLLFWDTNETITPSPIRTYDPPLLDEIILADIFMEAITQWYMVIDMHFSYLPMGESESAIKVWISQEPEETQLFTKVGPAKHLGSVVWSEGQTSIETDSLMVPWGINPERDYYITDLDDDRVADLVGFWLNGEGAPLTVYVKDTNDEWIQIYYADPFAR